MCLSSRLVRARGEDLDFRRARPYAAVGRSLAGFSVAVAHVDTREVRPGTPRLGRGTPPPPPLLLSTVGDVRTWGLMVVVIVVVIEGGGVGRAMTLPPGSGRGARAAHPRGAPSPPQRGGMGGAWTLAPPRPAPSLYSLPVSTPRSL